MASAQRPCARIKSYETQIAVGSFYRDPAIGLGSAVRIRSEYRPSTATNRRRNPAQRTARLQSSRLVVASGSTGEMSQIRKDQHADRPDPHHEDGETGGDIYVEFVRLGYHGMHRPTTLRRATRWLSCARRCCRPALARETSHRTLGRPAQHWRYDRAGSRNSMRSDASPPASSCPFPRFEPVGWLARGRVPADRGTAPRCVQILRSMGDPLPSSSSAMRRGTRLLQVLIATAILLRARLRRCRRGRDPACQRDRGARARHDLPFRARAAPR